MTPTPHPVLPIPSPAQLAALVASKGEMAAVEMLAARERAIQRERQDPLKYGFEPAATFGRVRRLIKEEGAKDILILGGNQSGKSEFCAKVYVEILSGKQDARGYAFQDNEKASVDRQQPYIHRYIPPEWRDIGKSGKTTYVKYTKKTGFSDGSFVLPNGALSRFMNYEMKDTAMEGDQVDIVWLDELAPLWVANTMRYRTITRGGLFLFSFTPLKGFTAAVSDYLSEASVLETLPAPLLPQDRVLVKDCPRGHMPYVMKCTTPGRWVVFFHSAINPYLNFANLQDVLANATQSEIMIRAYGYPTKQIAGACPKFSKVHIVPAAKVPKEGTRYQCTDPAGARNWFMLWALVDPLNRIFIYREWPDIRLGRWAEPADNPDGRIRHDGKPGPAQYAGAGRGIAAYKRLILIAEGKTLETAPVKAKKWTPLAAIPEKVSGPEEIWKRLMDPRAGSAQVPGVDEGTSLIDLFSSEQTDKDGLHLPSMHVLPAPGGRIEERVELINDLLDYDQEEPVTSMNCPRLFVADCCENLIYAMNTWTGADGEKGATKDPMDVLGYLVKEGLEYVDVTRLTLPGMGGVY